MRRRSVLALLTAPLFADAQQQVSDFFASLASALAEGNAIAFLKAFDSSMADYQKLQSNITALISQCEVQSSIDVLVDEGDDQRRSVELDWFLQIRSKQDTGPLVRRRERVKCRLGRVKKKWRAVSLEPVSFFAPLT